MCDTFGTSIEYLSSKTGSLRILYFPATCVCVLDGNLTPASYGDLEAMVMNPLDPGSLDDAVKYYGSLNDVISTVWTDAATKLNAMPPSDVSYFPHMYPVCAHSENAVRLEGDQNGRYHENTYFACESTFFPCDSQCRPDPERCLRRDGGEQYCEDDRQVCGDMCLPSGTTCGDKTWCGTVSPSFLTQRDSGLYTFEPTCACVSNGVLEWEEFELFAREHMDDDVIRNAIPYWTDPSDPNVWHVFDALYYNIQDQLNSLSSDNCPFVPGARLTCQTETGLPVIPVDSGTCSYICQSGLHPCNGQCRTEPDRCLTRNDGSEQYCEDDMQICGNSCIPEHALCNPISRCGSVEIPLVHFGSQLFRIPAPDCLCAQNGVLTPWSKDFLDSWFRTARTDSDMSMFDLAVDVFGSEEAALTAVRESALYQLELLPPSTECSVNEGAVLACPAQSGDKTRAYMADGCLYTCQEDFSFCGMTCARSCVSGIPSLERRGERATLSRVGAANSQNHLSSKVRIVRRWRGPTRLLAIKDDARL
ncbi:hypothetical protein NliqN6_5103 [Naganishia liquefaciens]|uniref:Uncharacterized protein n=1 Tax=Naganishia liquefaciens TaxID=104408 RepID=A0A8H3TXG8_9TREE|nr:hypothetical protein NliqN6_5103 [Naganishia liquefaciens]